MKRKLGLSVLCLLLSLVVLLQSAPMDVIALGTESFCLVVEAGGRLVIAPEHIPYTSGQTIREALEASGHTFTGMNDSSGMITAINGVNGNFTRSDENGGYDLDISAAEIGFFRFSEEEDSKPSEALTRLMTEMADYRLESADVQAAAKVPYEQALGAFVGAADGEAEAMAAAIADAITAYNTAQSGTLYSVTFSDGARPYTEENYNGVTITAENAYGKSYTDDGDAVLQLPAGVYAFAISWDGRHIRGQLQISADHMVSAAMPTGTWLVGDSFALSGSYGDDFDDAAFSMTRQDDRHFLAAVPDSFTGNIYAYAEYDTSALQTTPTLTAVYTNTGGILTECTLAFKSRQTGAADVLRQGAQGNRLIYRIGAVDANGFAVFQDYTVELTRTPSLKAIRVEDQDGAAQAAAEPFSPLSNSYTYKVVDTVTSVTVRPTPFDSSYTVAVNGTAAAAEGVRVPLAQDGAPTVITVTVSGGGYESAYTLTVCPGEGRGITFVTTSADVELIVVNKNGEELPYTKYKGTDSYNRYSYTLVPGESYQYLATKNGCYHTAGSFTMEEDADSTITVEVKTQDLLTELALGAAASASAKGGIALAEGFASDRHSYTVYLPDTDSSVYLWATAQGEAELTTIYAQIHYSSAADGVENVSTITSGSTKGLHLQKLLLPQNPYGNQVTLRVSQREGGITYYQDYSLNLIRKLSLQALSAQCNGNSVTLVQKDSENKGFSATVTDYVLNVPAAATELSLSPLVYEKGIVGGASNVRYGDDSTGYRVAVNGRDVTGEKAVSIALNGTQAQDEIIVSVTNEHCPEWKTDYRLTVRKHAPIYVDAVIDPAEGLVTMYETQSGNRIWPEGGCYMLSEGYTYTYTATACGYVGQSGTIAVTRDEAGALVLRLDGQVVSVTTGAEELSSRAQIAFTLTAAAENPTIDPSISSQWSDYRGNSNNNGITDAGVPFSADEGTLYWANKLGEGFGADAVGCPILVDGYLITYAGNTIYRVDTVSGEVVATGTMDHNSSYSITPPVYYEGMIFMALSEGTIQAFNAATLDSLWIYRDPLGGQPNSPMTVKDGRLYTGFWVSETADANFVCLTVTDEDPNRGNEEKCAVWYHTQKGGFYWAGAYAGDGYLLVGTDDGQNGYTSQTSRLLLMDLKTGCVMDSWDGLNADIRSTVSYDPLSDAYYFTAKGGSFYSVQVIQNGTGWSLTNKWNIALTNGSSATPMSTSTPVVYNGRAYVGVSGIGQFSDYSGHSITVIDLAKRSIAYRALTQGYPQTSGLLTTAYEQSSGYVYIYFFDNATPGKLRVLRDRAGQTSVDYATVEGGIDTPYVVFTPYGEQAQYAICSPITDEYGTVYFKNDSACLMAFGSRIERIEVTKAPDKTVYQDGEAFDPAGMVVTATYANGMIREITPYVSFAEEPLAAGDTAVTLVFPYVMYHNQDDGTGSTTPGIATTQPTVDVTVTVEERAKVMGDVNSDGTLDSKDAAAILQYLAELDVMLDLTVADYNGDGTVDSKDATGILQYLAGN